MVEETAQAAVQYPGMVELVNRTPEDIEFFFDGSPYFVPALGSAMLPEAIAAHGRRTNMYNVNPSARTAKYKLGIEGQHDTSPIPDYNPGDTGLSRRALEEEAALHGQRLVKVDIDGAQGHVEEGDERIPKDEV